MPAGTWHITDMEMWAEDYFDMETQAYIEIGDDGLETSSLAWSLDPLTGTSRTVAQNHVLPSRGKGGTRCTQ
jgi:hypothetical protein